jgi:hypothetical protein
MIVREKVPAEVMGRIDSVHFHACNEWFSASSLSLPALKFHFWVKDTGVSQIVYDVGCTFSALAVL